jgi:hypothetical protein
LGECECEWVARVPWESVGAGWKTKSAIARWKVECGCAVGECECECAVECEVWARCV